MILTASGCVSGPDNPNNPKNDTDPNNQNRFNQIKGQEFKTNNSIIRSNNELGFQLYKKLSDNQENVFLSPWSITTTLLMVYEGSEGETRSEIRNALDLPMNNTETRTHYREIHQSLNNETEYELNEANSLWHQRNYPISQNYTETIQNQYGGKITPLDFTNKQKAKERINNWVANKTKNKIPELLEEVSPRTRLILTNAIYFKGIWRYPFDEEKTTEELFKTGSGDEIPVPMMRDTEDLQYAEYEDFKALEMPYRLSTNQASMLVILPKDEEKSLEKLNDLSLQELNSIRKDLEAHKVDLSFPKFEYRTKYDRELKSSLKDLGMKKAFTDEANFNDITEGKNNFLISKMIHKAYIKINENGTEAAAATAAKLETSTEKNTRSTFNADHPFMFLIQQENGNILFIGRYTKLKD